MTNPRGPASLTTPSAQDNNTHDANGRLRTRSANLTYAAVVSASTQRTQIVSSASRMINPQGLAPIPTQITPSAAQASVLSSDKTSLNEAEPMSLQSGHFLIASGTSAGSRLSRTLSLVSRLAAVHWGFAVANSLAGSQLAGVAVINCKQSQDTLALAGVVVINCEQLQDTLAPICQLAGVAVINRKQLQDTLAPILVSPAVAISSTDPELAGIQINPGTVCK
ncbi:hypothetical protein PCASD_06204 [Puccinia coronata f. sp. avenae]|uniref:Uncharacterized protein n=1 Tax=Puccinia coronata f. sp. avenae TaxID=200324 RepID=A0A2N5TGP9_9BASI|nr:hypothetical protein PCASD_06204 [Puccinia coronata f. sp. avenae]